MERIPEGVAKFIQDRSFLSPIFLFKISIQIWEKLAPAIDRFASDQADNISQRVLI
jgi:hypothetical protein